MCGGGFFVSSPTRTYPRAFFVVTAAPGATWVNAPFTESGMLTLAERPRQSCVIGQRPASSSISLPADRRGFFDRGVVNMSHLDLGCFDLLAIVALVLISRAHSLL
jgi:hypothetical protein